MTRSYRLVLPFAVLLLAAGVACRKAPQRVNEVVAVSAAKLPLTPADPAWDRAPEHLAKLIPQDLVEPRLMKPSTGEVMVRALTNGSEVAFRLQWADKEKNDAPGPASMVDACAIQIPKKVDPNPPAPQMGEAGKPVELTFWRADWQAVVNGRGDTIRDLYPNASIDHYPYNAKSLEPGSAAQKEFASRYAPARALGNDRGGPRTSPVEDLVADGPGTLAPAASTTSKGQGARTATGWSVVISRRAPQGLAPRQRTQIAFAVWEGSQKESGARKMRTGWIPLLLQGEK
jgi:DMSO reductase family type II enzyme heme b subunit